MTLITIMALWALGIVLLIGFAVYRGRLPAKQDYTILAEPPHEHAQDSPKVVRPHAHVSVRGKWRRIKAYGEIASIVIKNMDDITELSSSGEKPKSAQSSNKVKKPVAH